MLRAHRYRLSIHNYSYLKWTAPMGNIIFENKLKFQQCLCKLRRNRHDECVYFIFNTLFQMKITTSYLPQHISPITKTKSIRKTKLFYQSKTQKQQSDFPLPHNEQTAPENVRITAESAMALFRTLSHFRLFSTGFCHVRICETRDKWFGCILIIPQQRGNGYYREGNARTPAASNLHLNEPLRRNLISVSEENVYFWR